MTKSEETYLVVGCKAWNKRVFNDILCKYPGKWLYFNSLDSFSDTYLKKINPRYVFFLHWSLLVPDFITQNYECICFHMTDVPFGRGGSPLQNLIVRGHHSTKLTALRMVREFDAGPVYQKRDLSLEGTAEEIYMRATYLSAEIILDIVKNEPRPTPQSGEVVVFKRRTPKQSEIQQFKNLPSLYDHIRMLDAESYPRAYFTYHGFRYEFSRAALHDGKIISDVVITKEEE